MGDPGLPALPDPNDPERSILLIGEEQETREYLIKLFQKENFEILAADTFEEGEKVLVGELGKKIILDEPLSNGNGLLFLNKNIGALQNRTVIINSHSLLSQEIDILNEGHIEYLEKPFKSDELLNLIMNLKQ